MRWSSTRVTLEPTRPVITPLDVAAMSQPPVAGSDFRVPRGGYVAARNSELANSELRLGGGERARSARFAGGRLQLLGPLHPGHDALVAGAAAEVARERRADL